MEYIDYRELHRDTINKLHQMVNSGKITVETACSICADFVQESEGERTRKELIKYIRKTTCVNFIGKCSKKEAEKFISWLEKQEEPLDKIAQRARTEKQRVLVTESDGVANIDWDTRSLQDVKLLLEYGLDYIKKIEKQGEQKHVAKYKVGDTIYYSSFGRSVSFVIANIVEDGTDNPMYEDKDGNSVFEKDLVEQKLTVEMKTPEESLGIDSDTYNKIVDECIYGEQKPANKVDPKFHKGDWIIHQGTENIYQVVALVDNQYQLKYGDNYTIQKCADVDRCTRLWDITKDAKAGDVLYNKDVNCGDSVFIFKSISSYTGSHLFYARLFKQSEFSVGNERQWDKGIGVKGGEFYPATKEERNLLFAKIKEAGYEWNVEKKELKKEKVDNLHNYLYGEQNPTWSEEDEERLSDAIFFVREYQIPTRDKRLLNAAKETEDWLKSLKDRVQLQPKQEWSTLDERNLQGIIDEIEANKNQAPDYDIETYDRFLNWLKSLRPQKQWKPSDEQMHYLSWIANVNLGESVVEQEVSKHLNELLEDLKKLKG